MSGYVNQLSPKEQSAILGKAKAHYETELDQEFTDEERNIVINSRISDLEEIIKEKEM